MTEPASRVNYVRANDPRGETWGTPIRVNEMESDSVSLLIVNGNPAISCVAEEGYYDYFINYMRALDVDGITWGNPIIPEGESYGEYLDCTMSVVNGNPAISYFWKGPNDLKYMRAKDPTGSTWEAPLTVDSEGTVGLYCSMTVIHGYPAVSYLDGTNNSLKYVRATDADGNNWREPVTVDDNNIYSGCTYLKAINDYPAISYVTDSELRFAIYY